jgi:hypothetical protein
MARIFLSRNKGRGAMAVLCLLAQISAASAETQEEKKDQRPSQEQQKPADPGLDQDRTAAGITAVPNRPTFASTAETVQRGVFEVEYGFEAAKGHQNINGLLKWGASKNLELWFLNNPIERDAGVVGIGDSGAGFKFAMIPQRKAIPKIAVLYVATLPTATAGLGSGASGHSVQLLFSKDLGKHHIDANEGVQFVGRPGASGYDRNYFTALSYFHPLAGKWGYTGEIAGFSRTNAATPATMTLLHAATYNVSPRLILDAGAYFAVYGNLPRVTFFGGVTYSIADLYHLHPARKPTKN